MLGQGFGSCHSSTRKLEAAAPRRSFIAISASTEQSVASGYMGSLSQRNYHLYKLTAKHLSYGLYGDCLTRLLEINRLSYNAGCVKYFSSTLLHALREERHFASFEESGTPNPLVDVLLHTMAISGLSHPAHRIS